MVININEIMKSIMKDPAIRVHRKEAQKYAQDLVNNNFLLDPVLLDIDDYNTLIENRNFLESELGVPINILSSDNIKDEDDPMKKSARSIPGRPAIYIKSF